jgi:AcrR family transcriptional regulator
MTGSKKVGTEEKIVEKALEMFNQLGVEYVGMRELAAALDMRIGNVTYYFPTKDALVDRLSLGLAEENNRTIIPVKDMTMRAFFDMLEKVFHNHVKYRCLMVSFVHLMERNPLIAKRYSKTQSQRNEVWRVNIEALRDGKYLKADAREDVDFLVASIAFIARFWISEAAISFKGTSEEVQIRHYIGMIVKIFLPYTTTKGRKEMAEVEVFW